MLERTLGEPISRAPGQGRPTTVGGYDDALHLEARLVHWRPVLLDRLSQLYGTVTDPVALADRLLDVARASARRRAPALRAIDAAREVDPGWFHANRHVGYVAYAERFGGTLAGVRDQLDYLAELSVDYLHLMKVLRPRAGANDGGYAIVDYGDVDPALGTRAELEALTAELHDRGMSLCLDLVINHTAAEHPWALAAQAGSARHRDYYLVFPDRTDPDAYEASLPEVFPEMAPGNFTWNPELAGWVWTTFNTYQWDLNYANPDVFAEMLDVMLDLANLGVDVLRLDAIAFTWKRMGTNCQNQPEAHLIAQAYRALLAVAAPAVLLKAEAIVAPADLLPYLGAHRLERDECQLAYHNQLMVMLWAALATGDARLATEALAALPPTPSGASWVTYLRCHDDIGWAVSDTDAGSLGMSGAAHRAHLAAFYRGDVLGSFARGAAFSSNPEIGDERTSGMAAALAGITAARRGETDLELAVRRLLLGYAVVFAFGGIPLVYMGDELALDNDESYLEDPDRAGDSRWMHRPMLDPGVQARRHQPGTIEHQVFSGFVALAAARRAQPSITTGGATFMHRYDDPAILAFERRHPRHGRFFALANLAPRPAAVPDGVFGYAGLSAPAVVHGAEHLSSGPGELIVAPYGMVWVVDAADADPEF